MFTSKKLLVVTLLFGFIQNSQANTTDIDTIAGVRDALDKSIAQLNKQISYLDKADESLKNLEKSEKEFFLGHSKKVREIKNIHKELIQQIQGIPEGKDLSIGHVTQNIKQLNNIEQQLLQTLPLIKEHASTEQTLKLTKVIEENLQEVNYLKELAQQLLSNKDLGKDFAVYRMDLADIKIKALEKSVRDLVFMVGFLIPFIGVGFGISLHNLFKLYP